MHDPNKQRSLKGWLKTRLKAYLTRDEWLSAFRLGQIAMQKKLTDASAWKEQWNTPPPAPPSLADLQASNEAFKTRNDAFATQIPLGVRAAALRDGIRKAAERQGRQR